LRGVAGTDSTNLFWRNQKVLANGCMCSVKKIVRLCYQYTFLFYSCSFFYILKLTAIHI
jgi:hypothetical protein